MSRSQRNDFVNQQIVKLETLLEQWEQFQVTARDPSEKEHSHSEILRLKKLITEYESELKGGAKVDENIQAPLLAPALRRNNRKWIVGIIIALLLIAAAAFFYLRSNEIAPDYSKYLSYINKGDSLIKVDKYPEARISYKKALQYNPGDSAVIKKIDYLKKADDLIAKNKFTEAKQMFRIIVEIAPSPTLSSKALAIKANDTSEKNTGNLQFSFEWKDGMLLISVSGGTPFQGSGTSPYEIEGLDCEDCVQWTNANNLYIGKVPHEKLTSFSISIKDSKGLTTASQKIPAYNISAVTPSAVTKSDNTVEENYSALVEEADKNFADNKFEQALANYMAALALKKGNDLDKKIEACNIEINKQKFIAAKNIPRISIAGNSFTMGFEDGLPGERPEHTVKLSSFEMGKTEVTVAQYRAYCGFTNKPMPPAPAGGWIEDNPITNVTWFEAKAYCDWVGGRLPTEAEWEYAAKEGGTSTKKYSGSNDLGRVALYKDNSGNRPGNVGRKQANSLGLYDMTGNVFEWCSDWYNAKYYAAADPVDPRGPGTGIEKVIRGGAYNSFTESTQDGNQLRVTYRNQTEPTARENYIGFRVLWEK